MAARIPLSVGSSPGAEQCRWGRGRPAAVPFRSSPLRPLDGRASAIRKVQGLLGVRVPSPRALLPFLLLWGPGTAPSIASGHGAPAPEWIHVAPDLSGPVDPCQADTEDGLDEDQLLELAGHYAHDALQIDLHVEFMEGGLRVVIPARAAAYPLRPVEPTVFCFQDAPVNAHLEFLPPAPGEEGGMKVLLVQQGDSLELVRQGW